MIVNFITDLYYRLSKVSRLIEFFFSTFTQTACALVANYCSNAALEEKTSGTFQFYCNVRHQHIHEEKLIWSDLALEYSTATVQLRWHTNLFFYSLVASFSIRVP